MTDRASDDGRIAASVDNVSDSRTPINAKSQSGAKKKNSVAYGTIEEPLLGSSRTDDVSDDPGEDETEIQERPTGVRFAILFFCILLGDFFSGYDISCVSTLTPVITDQFNTLNEVSWYGTSYLLASCATLLIYGQLYSFYSMKMVFELSFIVFILGSVICAAAPTSAVFILGRALSGLGSAGVFAGGSIILANITPLKTRPIYQAFSGGMESIAVALGPLISGAISAASNWRISFFIMVPSSAACCVAVYFFVHNLQRPENANLEPREKLRRLDLAGFFIYVPGMVCLILGLQWAGSEYAWGSWRIILLLTLFAVLAVAFLLVEHGAGMSSMLPLHLFRQRTFAASCLYTFCNSAALIIIDYYLPIYFQAIRRQTTLGSGIWFLPMALSFAAAILVGGPITSYVGYYNPIMLFGSGLMILGAILFTTFEPDTPAVKWIGYQIIYGIGCGLSFQQPYTAIQTVLPEPDVPTALVTLTFTQEIGGIVALSMSQNLFINRLLHNLAEQVPTLDLSNILNEGILGVIESAPDELFHEVIGAYNDSINFVFYFVVGLTGFTFICALGIEWRSVKEEKKE